MRTLIVDNYDSFVFNLYQLVGELGGEPQVVRNDSIPFDAVADLAPDRIIISPGPGRPDADGRFGISGELIARMGRHTPVLGVCLGHQGIACAFGGKVVRSTVPMHGKTSAIHHDGSGLFEGLPSPLTAMRYHSLVVDRASLPRALRVTAWTDDGTVMGLEHNELPIFGVQFHPESIGTAEGRQLVARFLSTKKSPRTEALGH